MHRSRISVNYNTSKKINCEIVVNGIRRNARQQKKKSGEIRLIILSRKYINNIIYFKD